MSKSSTSVSLTILLILSLFMVGMVHLGEAQTSGTSVSGIIATDTTWNQADSPYTLIGNILVNNGVTLTIQPGTTVNIGSYYLMVNGTLQAIGTSNNPVTLNSNTNSYGSSNTGIILTQYSSAWNNVTSTGCIIKYSVVNSQLTISNSAELDQNNINCGINVQSNINALQNGTATISGNAITGLISVGSTFGSAIIINNTITAGGISFGSMNAPSVQIIDNSISGCDIGISASCWGGYDSSTQIIMNNLIFDNTCGINIADWEGGGPTVENNTITNNTVGVCVSYPWGNNQPVLNSPIQFNNLGGNSKYDFQNQQPTTVNAIYNWWGTTDTQVISQVIYDYYDDFNIGVVTYDPFLNASNPLATIYSGSWVPVNPNPTLNPTNTYLNVAPNPVGVDQIVTMNFGLNQLPPLVNGIYGNGWINITIKVTFPDGHTETLRPFTTNSTGGTSTVFAPPQIGNFTLQASFLGETLSGVYYQPSNSNVVTLSVQQQPVQSPSPSPTPTTTSEGNNSQSSTLLVTTDKGAIVDLSLSGNINSSQISNAIISTNQSATSTIISFSLTGPSGTTGFSNITIAKNTIPYGKIPEIYIDDQLASNQGYAQDDNNYYVWYTTHFSTHQISIVFTGGEQATFNGSQSQSSLLEVVYGVTAGAAIVVAIIVVLLLIITNRKTETL